MIRSGEGSAVVTRRRLVAWGLAVLASPLLAACGGSPAPPAPSPPVTATATAVPLSQSAGTRSAGCAGPGCATPTAAPTPARPASPSPVVPASPASPAVVVQPASPAATSTEMLYRADFSRWQLGTTGGEYPTRSMYDPATGEFRATLLTPSGGKLYTWFAPAEYVFGDFRLEVDARKVAGPASMAYGVVFRAQTRAGGPPEEYYLFTISDEQVVTLNLVNAQGPTTVLAGRPRSTAIAQGGATNHLTVTCAGNLITPRINGQMVSTYSGALVAPGLIGLQIGAPPGIAAPDGLTAAFSNLVVSRAG